MVREHIQRVKSRAEKKIEAVLYVIVVHREFTERYEEDMSRAPERWQSRGMLERERGDRERERRAAVAAYDEVTRQSCQCFIERAGGYKAARSSEACR